ncbi:bifunctional demethylmenaquinone methyltransferase/2-methoxy-6-polyprenyl-1,4-benzoquinol methylase UbiE [Taibaiella sp. KBW10]|uniref:bifunctional demethylmenaquinone methyltransferase/2-methoxy-6-polyprenyl-1,4-benzoquinol methylase UbiE n=1 Tax=Taibaiella sp. KBW10 TaxID=2153357 RepID=UPI000F5AFC2C|nr:bifunctional demethylmenaquinone methyltransferase/2-methoxy-6-polyprenyl-1,4-benzoquinol methylase UbiE [Taibaiella sp. KBW10]RQO32103.1 bifunctional demethylmenaquinone methyltransferase/2-methoxy-6-polyprenyl-1,4-benzoquinol methylase UbiE [Taibaiella sp. KBW10]
MDNTRKVVVPLPESDLNKKEQVAGMFDRIAGKYDFLNHLLSMGIDKGWRRKAIKSIQPIQPKQILDVATGTGDFAIACLEIHPDKVTGVDISEGMLAVGKQKMTDKKLNDKIQLMYGDSENLPFEDNAFDAITCAYGVRNFEHLEKGLTQMHRVLRTEGRMAILEFSHPKRFPFSQIYKLYFKYILPTVGKAVSKDATAYTYLPQSVAAFPEGKAFTDILLKCGFKNVKAQPLTFGITTLYTAEK